ncbi:hypothetical protein ILYODFUR_034850 [Ilyodon furcidens]|uniref:Uncharacterized protein n=1 Tax=Ilyodon furcidens TaxID=33524 RepID=A0ABV0STC7_9TELE
MSLLTFLYHTEFQLSSSSRNGRVEEKFTCELLSLQISTLRRPVRHAGNGNKSVFSVGFIILGDVRATMCVELCMFNCVTKMDDSDMVLESLEVQMNLHLFS